MGTEEQPWDGHSSKHIRICLKGSVCEKLKQIGQSGKSKYLQALGEFNKKNNIFRIAFNAPSRHVFKVVYLGIGRCT